MRAKINDDAFGKTAVNSQNCECSRASGHEFRRKDDGDGPGLRHGVLRINPGNWAEQQSKRREACEY
jgi:hypothetical protein